MEYIKSVLWNFGDGRTSTELNPTHVYRMAGKYTWRLTVTDFFGNTATSSGTIRVSDFDYVTDTLHASYTDKCYRLALKPSQGVGAVEWSGANWIWPPAYCGTCKGIDDNGNQISLVANTANGRFYQVGVRDVWQDRVGSYGGSSIACSFKIKEHTAVAGEYQEIEHIESHVHMRPYWETNKDLSGFGSDGFLDDYAVGLNMYENGEQTTPSAKLTKVPRYGDYVYRERVEARRLQLEVTVDTSAWRCIKVQQMMMPIDKVSGPGYDYPTESTYQAEFSSPDLWLSRDNSKPVLNRATGSNFSGTRDTIGTGPDGYAKTALNLNAGQGIYMTGADSLTDDFTLSMWVGNVGSFPITLWRMGVSDGDTMRVRIVASGGGYAVQFTDGTNGDLRSLSWTGTGWVHIAVERSGTTLNIYENGVRLSATPMTDSTLGYGGTIWLAEDSFCTIYDARRNATAISAAALAYYYDDVVNNSGNGGLLPIRR